MAEVALPLAFDGEAHLLRYQFYLLAHGMIRAKQEFLADDDAEALEFATVLLDACSDVCSDYELWNGSRMLAQACNSHSAMTLESLERERQRHIVSLEETLYNSRWQLAKSARLAQLIEAAQKEQS